MELTLDNRLQRGGVLYDYVASRVEELLDYKRDSRVAVRIYWNDGIATAQGT